MNRKTNQGFTLLEVLVALTIVAMVMGSLFALFSQNKKLSLKSLEKIHYHQKINYAYYSSLLELELDNSEFTTSSPEVLESEKNTGSKIKKNWNISSVKLLEKGQPVFSVSKLTRKN